VDREVVDAGKERQAGYHPTVSTPQPELVRWIRVVGGENLGSGVTREIGDGNRGQVDVMIGIFDPEPDGMLAFGHEVGVEQARSHPGDERRDVDAAGEVNRQRVEDVVRQLLSTTPVLGGRARQKKVAAGPYRWVKNQLERHRRRHESRQLPRRSAVGVHS